MQNSVLLQEGCHMQKRKKRYSVSSYAASVAILNAGNQYMTHLSVNYYKQKQYNP